MNLGTENRNKLIAAAGLGALALILVVRAFWSSGSDSTPVTTASSITPTVAASPARRPAGRNKSGIKRSVTAPHSLDPELRYDWLAASEDAKYEGTQRNIFKAQAEIPQPVEKVNTDEAKANDIPPPPPPPPPINLKFFGFASKPGEAKKIFLSQGEDIFIATEGEVVDRRYKVVRISPMSVEIEDQMNSNRQSIPLTQG